MNFLDWLDEFISTLEAAEKPANDTGAWDNQMWIAQKLRYAVNVERANKASTRQGSTSPFPKSLAIYHLYFTDKPFDPPCG